MRRIISIALASISAILCIVIIVRAKTLFDAAFAIAILSTPGSLIATGISHGIAALPGEVRDIRLDLALLTLCSAAQYGAIGYYIGRVLEKLRQRAGNG